MDIYICDVIGCSSPANRFVSDDDPLSDRLCSYHWARLSVVAPDRAQEFVAIEPDDEAAVPQYADLSARSARVDSPAKPPDPEPVPPRRPERTKPPEATTTPTEAETGATPESLVAR